MRKNGEFVLYKVNIESIAEFAKRIVDKTFTMKIVVMMKILEPLFWKRHTYVHFISFLSIEMV